jgi:hypothetical protein
LAFTGVALMDTIYLWLDTPLADGEISLQLYTADLQLDYMGYIDYSTR